MVSHCMCVLLVQIIHSYLTALKSFISMLYNNSFHMTGGSAINKIKSKRKDLIKKKKKKTLGVALNQENSKVQNFFFLQKKKKKKQCRSAAQLAKRLTKGLFASQLYANAVSPQLRVAQPKFNVKKEKEQTKRTSTASRARPSGGTSTPPAVPCRPREPGAARGSFAWHAALTRRAGPASRTAFLPARPAGRSPSSRAPRRARAPNASVSQLSEPSGGCSRSQAPRAVRRRAALPHDVRGDYSLKHRLNPEIEKGLKYGIKNIDSSPLTRRRGSGGDHAASESPSSGTSSRFGGTSHTGGASTRSPRGDPPSAALCQAPALAVTSALRPWRCSHFPGSFLNKSQLPPAGWGPRSGARSSSAAQGRPRSGAARTQPARGKRAAGGGGPSPKHHGSNNEPN
ncbi:translation initiation factor IF-2-like [Cygnus atratus]|uniref:translation initiation factor IF-2-like n=1 Tax=Cygnus atratus TaxID=8868 RepID=UPI0015D640C9|nr:translation initiation factor IF-2-like [Cygnus atratus]